MLNKYARAFFNRVFAPIARALVNAGVSPDAVTIVGTIGVMAGALVFFPRGEFFVGTMVVTFFVFSDIIDGAMARMSGPLLRLGRVPRLDARPLRRRGRVRRHRCSGSRAAATTSGLCGARAVQPLRRVDRVVREGAGRGPRHDRERRHRRALGPARADPRRHRLHRATRSTCPTCRTARCGSSRCSARSRSASGSCWSVGRRWRRSLDERGSRGHAAGAPRRPGVHGRAGASPGTCRSERSAAAFDRFADMLWSRRGRGRRPARAQPAPGRRAEASDADLRELSRTAMRSYLRYWAETFRLPVWSPERIRSGVTVVGDDRLRGHISTGVGVVLALPHMRELGPGRRLAGRLRRPVHHGRGTAAPGAALRRVRRVPRGPRHGGARARTGPVGRHRGVRHAVRAAARGPRRLPRRGSGPDRGGGGRRVLRRDRAHAGRPRGPVGQHRSGTAAHDALVRRRRNAAAGPPRGRPADVRLPPGAGRGDDSAARERVRGRDQGTPDGLAHAAAALGGRSAAASRIPAAGSTKRRADVPTRPPGS